jgi:Probable lipid transfer
MSYFQNSQSTFFLIMVSLTLMLTYVTNAQTMPPSPASSVTPECVNALFNLSDCLTYVETGSNATKPDKPCCPELAGLIESSPICLCELLNGAAESYGISVDNERALALPKVCHIITPPLSTCAGKLQGVL